MNEDRRKHLEFIQNIITRMNTNSFQIKGWAVTLVSALFALVATSESNPSGSLSIVAIAPILPFWILDGFFLSRERKFRALYEDSIRENSSIPGYSLKISAYSEGKTRWISGIFSKTLLFFYLALLGIAGVISILMLFLAECPA